MLSDSGRCAPRIDEIFGILKWLKDETSTDLTALEKDELDRKTKHQGLVKAEPRPARLPPTREKLQSTGMHERSCATVEMSFESAQQRFNVVTCIFVQRHEAASQEGVMIFHHCLSIPINSLLEALEMKARSPEKFVDVSDVKVLDEDGFLSCSMMIKAKNIIMKERIYRVAQRGHVFSICILNRDVVRFIVEK